MKLFIKSIQQVSFDCGLGLNKLKRQFGGFIKAFIDNKTLKINLLLSNIFNIYNSQNSK